jgi:hypothetical protein
MPEQWPGEVPDDMQGCHGMLFALLFSGGLVLAILGLVLLFRYWL